MHARHPAADIDAVPAVFGTNLSMQDRLFVEKYEKMKDQPHSKYVCQHPQVPKKQCVTWDDQDTSNVPRITKHVKQLL